MKKFLVIIAIVLMTTPAFAQARGALTNVYATWNSVTGITTVDMPLKNATEKYKSRDVWIQNGSAVDICISLKGEAITGSCLVGSPNSSFQLNGASQFFAQDFVTESITMISSTGAAASPVSVVVTY